MKKPRVLLVDDEAIIRDSVSEWLKSDGYEVECACGGLEALEELSRSKFDILVVDYKMPGIDGNETLKRARKLVPNIKVIVITAYGNLEVAVLVMKSGANDFLSKPFTVDKLEKAIEESFSSTREVSSAKSAKQCVWSKAGMISYRLCGNAFRCRKCAFNEYVESSLDPEIIKIVAKIKAIGFKSGVGG